MKIFKRTRLSLLIYVSSLCLLNVYCNEISQGDQRRKFEFLYKMNNYSSLVKEISNELVYYKNLSFFESKITIIKDEINRMEVLKNWDQSSAIKYDFIRLLDEDLISVYELKKLELDPDSNIRNELDVVRINDRIKFFNESLSILIVEVGKEN